MTWDAALALSIPLGVALYLGLVHAAKIRAAARASVERRRLKHDAEWAEERISREDERAREHFKTLVRVAEIDAEARVRAAKYASGSIKPKPRREEPEDPSPFRLWMDSDGRRKDAATQDMCEAAFAFIAGEDSGAEMGEYGSREGAERILNEHAGTGWAAAAFEHAKKAVGKR